MINIPTVLCTSSYKDIEKGHFAQAKENKKGILQNRKKKSCLKFGLKPILEFFRQGENRSERANVRKREHL